MTDAITAYEQRVRTLVAQHPRMSDARLAALIVKATPPEQYRAILESHTMIEVLIAKLHYARIVEEEARRREPVGNVSKTPEMPESPPKFQQLYDDPTLWGFDDGKVWFNSTMRRQFYGWINKRDGKDGFSTWLSAALELVDDEDFRFDWISGYAERARSDVVGKILAGYAEKIRFEVTAELLDTIFATGDGTRVSWRDATVLQHEDRIELLTKMIAGTSTTAAMHIRAVQMIKDAGVETLGQVPNA